MTCRTILVLLTNAILLSALCYAQVNFSPTWGKRTVTQEECTSKPSMELLMYLYKMIENEAQKISDCEKFRS
ncbi:hypertrehalosaemic prohormone [Bemisia tabaci]|uniref:hypertrehalosaemic prohormone n=1 Tax=Bemisia tabaci TaxID=7038 RepID=UPI0008F991C1|nr:PREDICTED: hypertrehalosaemic prohormone-like [Bemisia tabaci]